MILLFIIPFSLFILIFKKMSIREKQRWMILWTLLLFIVVGFRANSPEGDYAAYYDLFLNFQEDDTWLLEAMLSGVGIGFAGMSHYIANYEAIIAIFAFVTVLIFVVFINRHTKLPFLALFIFIGYFFYQYLIEQYRQCLAIAIVVWAIEYREKKIKSILLILIAYLFHPTALIAGIMFFVPNNVKKLFVYIIAFAAVFLLSSSLETYINEFAGDYVLDRYEFYTNYADKKEVAIGLLDMSMMIRIFLFGLCYYYRDKLTQIPNMGYYLNLYFVSLLIYKGFSAVPEMAVRGSIYFSFLEVILSANIVYCLRKEPIGKIICLVLIGLSIYRQLRFILYFDSEYSFNLIF